ncbi:ABC transporter ATP-binding protein [Aeromonas hydrophila]|uniref:ABC transporter ATP-binding protein n=1 Tax=Aeromonas hydrophila TaxID=644 RepID=UPI003EC6A30A
MFSDIAIKVENLSKCYEVYDTPRDRLKQFIFPRMQSVVRIVDRQNYFREFWALRNVNFEVKKGETVGIIGCNGSGKSTLLQMICGTLNPTSGSINTKGRIAALLELGSGFNPEFTGRENVYLNGAVLGLSNKEIDERFDDIADFADIGEFIERPVKTYSSGMTVRLAFAVQAMVDPDILVVDEALAVGDEKFQRKCFARLEELKSKGSSILFVSHSSASIVELCDRTLLLDHGNQLVFGDSPSVVRIYQKILYASIDSRERFIRELLADEISSHNQDVNIEEKSECSNITIKTEAKKINSTMPMILG